MADMIRDTGASMASVLREEMAGLCADAVRRDFERAYGASFSAQSDAFLLRMARQISEYVTARRLADTLTDDGR